MPIDSAYFRNCIKAIRGTVYGRDNRKPIADAIERVKQYNDGKVPAVLQPSEVSVEATTDAGNFTLVFDLVNDNYGYKSEWSIFDDGYGKGNIDLNHRAIVRNMDGSISTERSFSAGFEKSELANVISSSTLDEFSVSVIEVLLPSVINGIIYSEDDATDYFLQHGEYLGLFSTVNEAEEYAETLHERQEWYYR